ncbi:MAG: hypothetical protein HY540_01480 [Deltaproteobacteria bacterium]|nr:hypothetical protein [Deltaproteobacteria bacterium]
MNCAQLLMLLLMTLAVNLLLLGCGADTPSLPKIQLQLTEPKFVGVSDPSQILLPNILPLPELGQPMLELPFKTTLRRITDRSAKAGFGTHIYSQLQAFDPDETFVLLIEDGEYVVRAVDSLKKLPLDLRDINAPRWHPTLPHTLIFYDSNQNKEIELQSVDVEVGDVAPLYTFPKQYSRVRNNQSFDEVSRDGRWITGMAAMANGDSVIFSSDMTDGMMRAELSLAELYSTVCKPDPQYGNVEPDWVSASPLGKWLVVQWARAGTTRCSGLETFDIFTGEYVGRVYDGIQHGDLGVMPGGKDEFFMTFEMTHPLNNGQPGQGLRLLPGEYKGVQKPVYLQMMDWGTQGHISCQGPAGLCLVSGSGDPATMQVPFAGELFLQFTDGRIMRLAHHHSTECRYWSQPRASISQSGRYAIFASDWGNCGDTDNSEAYILELSETN